MNRKDKVNVMQTSEGETVRVVDKEGNEWTGTVDIYESEFENANDDVKGSSICVTTTEGFTMLLYDKDISEIAIIAGD